jgi:hypothetical protein
VAGLPVAPQATTADATGHAATGIARSEAQVYSYGRPDPDRGARPCHHVSVVVSIRPHSEVCQECVRRHDEWVGLWLCLSCGWVACSDDSPHRHAWAHYEETDHPIAAALGPGSPRRWCHAHQRTV